MTQDPIIRDMLAKRDELDRQQRGFATLDEAVAWMERNVKILRGCQCCPIDQRLPAHSSTVRRIALTVMADGYRLLRDLGLETEAACAEKDIPF